MCFYVNRNIYYGTIYYSIYIKHNIATLNKWLVASRRATTTHKYSSSSGSNHLEHFHFAKYANEIISRKIKFK